MAVGNAKIGVKVPLNYSEDGYQGTLTIAEEAISDNRWLHI